MRYASRLVVGEREISMDSPSYFIADIASNHDGDLERAKDLVWLAREAGADAAKFQHFKASELVSDRGFQSISVSATHQDEWGKSVYDVYEENEYHRDWDEALDIECKKADVHFMTSPYDMAAIDSMVDRVTAFKIGSGDITTPDILKRVAEKGKPVFLACGASSLEDVVRAVDFILEQTPDLALMQCNTNYTGSVENFHHINLRVLQDFANRWPGMIQGLSDHTPGHSTVLAAVAMGARCIEKHFTDDNARSGPDHPFSMNPRSWREMVDRTREVEAALGDGKKRVQDNEQQTVIVQRRGLYVRNDVMAGHVLCSEDLVSLRPAPESAFFPYERQLVEGKSLRVGKLKGDPLFRTDVDFGV